MELNPIYVLKGSPVNESPLGLFPPERYAQILQDEYGIPRRYLTGIMSPWALKRLPNSVATSASSRGAR
jgi:serine protein kinase